MSNLSELSKFTEKVVHQQDYQYLHGHGLLHPDHHGFLQSHSTATALQQLVDIWLRSADAGKLSATILLDLRTGFDVINHKLFIDKLKEYKFGETTLSWSCSYPMGRHECVQIEFSFSSFLSIPWGIPQGSIFGPLLFTIYVNELPVVVKEADMVEDVTYEFDDDTEEDEQDKTSVVVFADDNSITTFHQDAEVLQQKIQAKSKEVIDWFKINEITCSSEKRSFSS